MPLHADITAQTNGAHFLRADMHIHSYGNSGSYDVADPDMTPAGIIDKCIAENLKVIAITDHNTTGNVAEAVQ
jgi:predicted metal-dependent phosphoesterase TrpH